MKLEAIVMGGTGVFPFRKIGSFMQVRFAFPS
jgi:hypothetical protein